MGKKTFEGKLLIEVPRAVYAINPLKGGFGRMILREYNSVVDQEYSGSKILKVLSYKNGIVWGSTAHSIVLMNEILIKYGLSVARLKDLEIARRLGRLNLEGTLVDSALILRSKGFPNSYEAKDLIDQTNGRLEFPAVIPYCYLKLKKNPSSPTLLSFKLMEGAEVICAPQLGLERRKEYEEEGLESDGEYKEKYRRFSKINKYALPTSFNERGKRVIHLRNSGLCRLCLSGGKDILSAYKDLSKSEPGGIIIVVGKMKTPRDILGKIMSEYNFQLERR